MKKLGKATYSTVANELIKHLREKPDIIEMGEDEDEEEDTEYSVEESPDKRVTNSIAKKEQEETKGIEKWEKNVKRRVYDALNVLYAAGVLRKEGKYVYCNPEALDLSRAACTHIPMQEVFEEPDNKQD